MSIPPEYPRLKVYVGQSTSVLTNRYLNRGTAFTEEQRKKLRIVGLLPAAVETLDEQVDRCYEQLCLFEKPINKYNHLASIHASNTTLYYAVIMKHLEEMLPIIYTPTVGEACQKFSNIFIRSRGLHLSRLLKGRFSEAIECLRYPDVKVIVITDGSRILGLGDLGANGVGISLGKCSLYIAGAGLHPMNVLPVILDAGTNTESYLSDKEYLGLRERRCDDDLFYSMMDEFMESAKAAWPGAVIQFEDFSNNHCFDVLERYQNKYRCFNDDIQGTGAVISAGFLNAIKLSGVPAEQQRIVVFGAGSAAVGVAMSIARLAARLHNLKYEDVLKTFYLVDTKGLVTDTRGDTLAAHKVALARHDVTAEESKRLTTLEEVVAHVKPTALLGLGGVGPVFTETVVRAVAENTPRPIIFPLSNPTSKSECNPEHAYRWTNGTAIIASGSPYPASVHNGVTLKPSQGNNLYVFPGIGLGCAIAKPTFIPDELLIAASACLNRLTTPAQLQEGQLYPPLADIHDISAHIATDVILEAQRLGLVSDESIPKDQDSLLALVRSRMWKPHYPEELGYDIVE